MRNTARKDEGGAEEERSNLLTSKSCTMAPAGKVAVQQSRGRCKLPPPQLRSPGLGGSVYRATPTRQGCLGEAKP